MSTVTEETRDEAPKIGSEIEMPKMKRQDPKEVEKGFKLLDRLNIDTTDMSVEEMIQKVEKIRTFKEVSATVLTRGQTLAGMERLLKYVPKGMVGEFKRDDPDEIARAKALGWKVFEHEEAKRDSLTGSADNKMRIGDLILCVMPEEQYAGLILSREERIADRRGRRTAATVPAQGDGTMSADPTFPVFNI